jgi:hypothetical protein
MRGRAGALMVLLIFLAILALVFVIKKHAEQSQIQTPKNVTVVKRPYVYNISWKIVSPMKLELLVNVTKPGNVREMLIINVSKLIYPGNLVQLKTFKLTLTPIKKLLALNITIPVNPKQDEKVIVTIKDLFRNKIFSIVIPLYHHVYRISSKLLDNYTLLLQGRVVNYTLLRDNLRLMVYINTPISSQKLLDYSFSVAPSVSAEVKKESRCSYSYCLNFSLNNGNISALVRWKLIGFPWANVSVQLVDTTLLSSDSAFSNKATIYNVSYQVFPPSVQFDTDYTTPENLVIRGSVLYGTFNKPIYNFVYYVYGRQHVVNLTCKEINGLEMCYGIISLSISNHDSIGHDVKLDPNSIVCVNDLGAFYSWKEYRGILGDTSFHLEPMQTKIVYVYCLLPKDSKLKELYLRYTVDRNPEELIISAY